MNSVSDNYASAEFTTKNSNKFKIENSLHTSLVAISTMNNYGFCTCHRSTYLAEKKKHSYKTCNFSHQKKD